jgi:DNA-binding response OmpR family regulator
VSDPACVLVVEADVLVRHPLAEFLRECGYQVVEALDAAEARVLLDARKVTPDVLLARGPQGFGLAQWVREHHPRVQVELAGSLERATEKAADICEDGPAEALPYEHKFVLERIKQLLAARERAEKG